MSFSDAVSWFRQISDISEKADHIKLLETLTDTDGCAILLFVCCQVRPVARAEGSQGSVTLPAID